MKIKFADKLSIIFVHGLGSNPDTTWRARTPRTTPNNIDEASSDTDQYVNWVTDFLSDDLPLAVRSDVRLFFYNYDSYWERAAVYTRLQTLGNDLLEHILNSRVPEAVSNVYCDRLRFRVLLTTGDRSEADA